MSKTYRGSCLCGAVIFEIDSFLPKIAHCHCRMCRKFHGASYATIAGVKRKYFRWIQGEKELKKYTAPNKTIRTFCQHCGSSLLFWSPKGDSDTIEIALATVDGELPIEISAHIYVDSGASWTEINDGLPCYSAGRSGKQVDKT